MKTSKQKKLYAFKIQPNTISSATTDFVQLFDKKMDSLKTINDRLFELNKDSSEQDCLLFKEETVDGDLFCLLARVVPSLEVGAINEDMLAREMITANDLKYDVSSFLKSKRLIYFLIGREYIISDYIHINSLMVYANHFLGRGKKDSFKALPLLSPPKEINLSSIKSIKIGDAFRIDNSIRSIRQRVSAELLALIVNDKRIAEELIDKDLIDAYVDLRLKSKPKDMTQEQFEDLLSKAISVDEGVEVETKDRRTIKGEEIRTQKSVEVELLSDALINEQDLRSKMAEFLNELEQ